MCIYLWSHCRSRTNFSGKKKKDTFLRTPLNKIHNKSSTVLGEINFDGVELSHQKQGVSFAQSGLFYIL